MKRLLCAALLCAAGTAFAERVAKQGDDEVRLYDKPCDVADVLKRLPQEYYGAYQLAAGKFGGQMYQACWRDIGSVTHVIYEDGDQGAIPNDEIKESLGA